MGDWSRREFLNKSAKLSWAAILGSCYKAPYNAWASKEVPLSGHLWLYASQFPPDWDCTPILEQVFKDFKYAGLEGIEVMESILRHDDVVPRVGKLIEKYDMPITGSSYYGDMWMASQHKEIVEDVEIVVERLHQLGGSTFGITVGDAAGRKKTERELDAQADCLKEVMRICETNQIQPNMHNHTFEVENDLYDLKGTVERIPDLKLGPDLNWLIRAGVDPVWFIKKYGDKIVYLHIRDQDSDGKWVKTVGAGVIDFPAIADALKEVNFDGRAAIELAFEHPPTGPVREYWKDSREYVKEVFGW